MFKNVVFRLKKSKIFGLCSVALATLFIASSNVSADSWKANSWENISVVKGQETYVVKAGDTLWGISKKAEIKLKDLAELNNIDLVKGEELKLRVGQVLKLVAGSNKVVESSFIEGNVLSIKEFQLPEQFFETGKSDSSRTEISKSETSKPETSKPETSKPETSKPETSKPETSKSETSKPETSKSETSKPETSKPETSKPETSKPETSKPETSKSETSKPDNKKTERVINTVVWNGKILSGRTLLGGKQIKLNTVVDFGNVPFQSFYIEDGYFKILNSVENSPVRVFDKSGLEKSNIEKSSTGHNNDVEVFGNLKFITPGGTKMYIWNTDDNSVKNVELTTISQYEKDNNTRIDIGGVTKSSKDSSILYLVGRDQKTDNVIEAKEGSDVIAFSYNLKTGEQKFLFKDVLDYIGLMQGTVEHNGILYVAQNSKTDNYNLENYTGITIKAYDTTDFSHIDDVQIDGSLEAEGMQVVQREDGTDEIGFGLTGTNLEKIVTFEPLEKKTDDVVNENEVSDSTIVLKNDTNDNSLDNVNELSSGELKGEINE